VPTLSSNALAEGAFCLICSYPNPAVGASVVCGFVQSQFACPRAESGRARPQFADELPAAASILICTSAIPSRRPSLPFPSSFGDVGCGISIVMICALPSVVKGSVTSVIEDDRRKVCISLPIRMVKGNCELGPKALAIKRKSKCRGKGDDILI